MTAETPTPPPLTGCPVNTCPNVRDWAEIEGLSGATVVPSLRRNSADPDGGLNPGRSLHAMGIQHLNGGGPAMKQLSIPLAAPV